MRALTPMGDRIKEDVKARSEMKKESMGVCFLRGAHYADYLCERCSEAMQSGEVTDRNGMVVGHHQGVARYTIGQRRGDGIPAGSRVVAIDAQRDRVVVGSNEELFSRTLHLENCHFINPREVESSECIEVMVRGIGRNPKGYARLDITESGAIVYLLDDMAWAAASGQPVALYIGDRVVGGGYLI